MMKKRRGFTLIEAIIALAVWMILSVSVIFVWQHVSNRSSAVMERQNALENARVAMDALIINIQMAQELRLDVRYGTFVLRRLVAYGYGYDDVINDFTFNFNCRLRPVAPNYRRLLYGNNELASNIAEIYIRPVGERYHETHILIKITTGCEYPIVLESSVDIRHTQLIEFRRLVL